MPVALRLVLFYFFVALFLILLPIFMLSSLGYRYNSATHSFQRLGMISLRTYPEEASITLNKKRLKQKTPAKLTNLFPGKYSLLLEKKGFKSWSEEVEVRSNWVTQLESIFLFPEKMRFLPVTDLAAASFFPSPKSRKMVIWGKSSEDSGLWLLNLFLEEETLILEENQVPPGFFSRDMEIYWSKNERSIVIQKKGQCFLLNFKKPNHIVNVKNIIGFDEEPTVSQGTEKTFQFDANKIISLNQKHAFLRQVGPEAVGYTQKIFSFPAGWKQIYFDSQFKQLYFIQGSRLMRVNLAYGRFSKLMENMRETMSGSVQFFSEVGKKNETEE